MTVTPAPSFEHLYVHVPFCRRRCSYCDFAIAVRREVPARRFVDAVMTEIARRHEECASLSRLRSIYLGGGTPSLLDPSALDTLLGGIRERWPLVEGAEITIEANPEDVDPATVAGWTTLGITRVSLGIQSLQAPALAWMHRTHTADAAINALRTLHDSHISSVSIDIIFGLPRGVYADPVGDVARLVEAHELTHVSAYGLTVESGTPLAKWESRGAVVSAGEDRYVTEFCGVRRVLCEAGFEHYEVSNYARPGFGSVHNTGYWRGAAYLGVGPSAHSFAGATRWWNVRDWAAYESLISRGADPIAGREVLDSSSRWLETVYLGLRTADGLDEGVSRLLPNAVVERLISQGLLESGGGRLRATSGGWLRLDEVVTLLTTSGEGG